MKKRVLAFLMVIAMVFSLLPVTIVTAEGEEATPGYTMTLQKAHNQTDGLAVDVYLQANTADQGDVTGYNFTVNPAEGLLLTHVADATGNDALDTANGYVVYPPTGETADPIAVGTGKVLVATITVNGESLPAQVADAVTLTAEKVTTATAEYVPTVQTLSYGCTDHECGHGTGTWTGVSALSGDLAAGNYYLTDNVTLTAAVDVAQDAHVRICLNGFNIEAAAGKRIFELDHTGATLEICDCTATGEGADYTAGKLLPKYNYGGAIRVNVGTGATVNFHGGIIDGSLNESQIEGSAMWIIGNSTLNMTGGKIVGLAGRVVSGDTHGPIILRGTASGEVVANISNVVFENCGTAFLTATNGGGAGSAAEQKNDTVILTVKDVTALDSQAGAYVIDASFDVFKSITIEGDCRFDVPVFVPDGKNVTLNLGENANVRIETEDLITEEQFNERATLAEGGSLTAGTLIYENGGCYVTYENGKFVFGEGHIHNGILFKLWDNPNELPASGNWYLACDVNVSATTVVQGNRDLHLDLNGKKITGGTKRIFEVWLADLNLYDCTSQYDAEGNWIGAGQGELSGCTSDFGAIRVHSGGVFNMYGGRLANNGGGQTAASNGGAIYLYDYEDGRDQPGAIFNMYGGEITGNKTGFAGSAVTTFTASTDTEYVNAQINISGGKIYNNDCYRTDTTTAGGSGTIYATGKTAITVTGGEFTGNTARNGGVFNIHTNVTLNISGGKFNNNHANNIGGVIYMNDNAQVTVTGGEWDGNSADFTSGVLEALGGTVSFSNVTIQNSSAPSAGAVYLHTATDKTVVASFTNCILTGNTALTGPGSALRANAATLILDDTVITDNTCETSGVYTCGAVYFATKMDVTLSGATVISGNNGLNPLANDLVLQYNAVKTLYVDELTAGSHVNVYNMNPDSLAATTLVQVAEGKTQTDWDCGWITYFETTTAKSYKAVPGKSVSRVDLTPDDGVDNPEFTFGHYHEDEDGNLVAFKEWSSATAPTTAGNYYLSANIVSTKSWIPPAGTVICFNGRTMTQDQTAHDNSKNSAGAIVGFAAFTTSGTLTLMDCTATYDAEGYLISGGTIQGFQRSGNGAMIANTSGSNVTTTYVSGIEFADAYDYQYTTSWGYGGGAIHVRGNQSLYVDGCKFTGNYSHSGGGAIQIQGASGKTKTVEIKNSLFTDNHTAHNGGAISISGYSSSNDAVLIENCKFDGNYTTTYAPSGATAETQATSDSGRGGAVSVRKATANIKNCEFIGNQALHNPNVVQNLKNSAQGGALYSDSGVLNLDSNCTFIGNHADQFGGAIFSYGANTYTGTFKNNTADDHGGAIHAEAGTTISSGAVFEGNAATNGGGAIFHKKNLTVSGATFKNNGTAVLEDGSKITTVTGGAIYSEITADSTVTIKENCVFEGNTTTGTGGGGGAIRTNTQPGGSGTTVYKLTMTVADSTFKNNSSADYAGAIWARNNTDLTVTDSTFEGNVGKNGGVFHTAEKEVDMTASGCTFTGNNATNRGGVYYYQAGALVTFDDCHFTDNTAKNLGGAIYVYGSTGTTSTLKVGETTGCTFTGNQANIGGAMHIESRTNSDHPSVLVANSTFTENSATSGGAIAIYWGAVVTLKDITVQNNTTTDSGAVYIDTNYSPVTLEGKVVISGNTNSSSENANLVFQHETETTGEGDEAVTTNIDPVVGISGLTEGSNIGVDMLADRFAEAPVFTINGGAAAKAYVHSDSDLYLVAEQDGELKLTKYIDEDGTTYQTVQAAIDAAITAGETSFAMQTSTTEELTLSENLLIDLNGKDVGKITVAETKTLTLIDSETNDYNVDDEFGYGTTTVEGDVATFSEVDGKRYAVITAEDGTVSAHRIYLAINSKVLRTHNEGLGFGTIFAGDQVVAEAINAGKMHYGIELCWNDKDMADVKTGVFDVEFTAGIEGTNTPNQTTAVVTGVLKDSNGAAYTNGDTLYGRPVMEINGEPVIGDVVDVTMKEMVEAGLNTEFADAVRAMLNKYETTN